MEKGRISYHESVLKVYERIKEDVITNIWDHYEAQGFEDPDKRCPFCMGGVCCDFCSNDPCQADAEKGKRGVCGIAADGGRENTLCDPGTGEVENFSPETRVTDRRLRKGHRPGPGRAEGFVAEARSLPRRNPQ